MGLKYSRFVCFRSETGDVLQGETIGLTVTNPTGSGNDSISLKSLSSSRSTKTFIYEGDVDTVRKWKEEAPLTVDLPPPVQSPYEKNLFQSRLSEDGVDRQKPRRKPREKCHYQDKEETGKTPNEVSCRVSMKSQRSPDDEHKLQWRFKLYDVQGVQSMSEMEAASLMRSVCKMVVTQVSQGQRVPRHKRFTVKLNVTPSQQNGERNGPGVSRLSMMTKPDHQRLLSTPAHSEGCTTCATCSAGDRAAAKERREVKKSVMPVGSGLEPDGVVLLRRRRHPMGSDHCRRHSAASPEIKKSGLGTEAQKRRNRHSCVPSTAVADVRREKEVERGDKAIGNKSRRHAHKRYSHQEDSPAGVDFRKQEHHPRHRRHDHTVDTVQVSTVSSDWEKSSSSSGMVHHHHHEHHHHHYHVYHHM
eukprot:m.99445 g.99445  ORF g.99445 m.99445 type:complete len:416 (+) comp37067_c0_seq19:2727-3974(+)